MLALDLFCGGGGVALGLLRAGYRVVGIDHQPQPDYPGDFLRADALHPPVDLAAFDLIWASPPCQHDCGMRRANAVKPAPNFVPRVQELLAGHPWTVIEQTTPHQLAAPIYLELGMFRPPQQVGNHRRRYFQCSWPILAPGLPPRSHYAPCMVSLTGNGSYGGRERQKRDIGIRRAAAQLPKSSTPEEASAVLGVEHIRSGNIGQRRERINNALPPDYSEFIGVHRLAMGVMVEHRRLAMGGP